MTQEESISVVLFESTSHALFAEKLIKAAQIPCKLIPIPRHLSSDCGVCLRFGTDAKEQVEGILRGKLDVFNIRIL
jgi:hypothetical protein